ncbi:T9SS type A sorting domain-containing protein, partial [bacterium]|nr:T9SS type A sorting domain-containing protein [bacterium]
SSAMDLEVLFRVDMRVQILTGDFDPDNDVVMVRGGTPPLEWGGSANQLPEVTGSPGLYSDWVQFDAIPYPGAIDFKYVILTNGDPDSPIWEQPAAGGNRQATFNGTEPDNLPPPNGNGYQEVQLDTVFFSDVTFEDITENPVDVIFTCDVRPAYLAIADIGYILDVQTGEDTVRVINGVGINGLWNIWTWGSIPEAQQLHDDGVAPDEVAGDSIWTVSIHFDAGTARPHPYKYGANDYDNEAGFGADHTLILDDSSPTMILPVDCWGILGDLFDDYLWVCGDAAEPIHDAAIPEVFTLYQNYPNPFNPTTQISFSLPSPNQVTFKVFNVLGQEVAKMDLGPRAAGLHHIQFSAENLSTGLYFYSVDAGSMHAVRKMLVLK